MAPAPASAVRPGKVKETSKAVSQLNKVARAIAAPRMARGKISASTTHNTGPHVAENVLVNTTNATTAITKSAVEWGERNNTVTPIASKLAEVPVRPANRMGLRPRRSTIFDCTTTAMVAMLSSPLRKANNSALESETPKLVKMVGTVVPKLMMNAVPPAGLRSRMVRGLGAKVVGHQGGAVFRHVGA